MDNLTIKSSIILFSLAFSTQLLAAEITPKLKCNTHARAGYINTHAQSGAEKALALGGRIGCNMQITDSISLNSALHTSLNPGINSDNNLTIHGDFFDDNKNSYILLGESALNLEFRHLTMTLGRQYFDR